MLPSRRRIAALLADWRSKVARTNSTRAGSVERSDADRTERRARWAYEDESLRQHDAHGMLEPMTRKAGRIIGRGDELREDSAEHKGRASRLSDEEEFDRELGPD